MSENIKLRFEQPTASLQGSADPLHGANPAADDGSQADEAESQMRKALGLLGDSSRQRPETERAEASNRGSERFSGGLHRRRFVQDGDVPVTVLRREPGQDVPAHRSTATVAAPSSSRLQRIEAALAIETAGREKAERLLAETQAAARDLQTKIGHAELAKNEAINTLRHEREEVAGLRIELESLTLRLNETQAHAEAADQALQEQQALLADARHANKLQEKALQASELARDAAEELVRTFSQPAPELPHSPEPPLSPEPPRNAGLSRRRKVPERALPELGLPEPEGLATKSRRGRPAAVVPQDVEPEPVKWWLAPAKPAIRRK